MGISFLVGPINILHGIYAKYFGLPLVTIATVLMISRIFDALSDPLVGILADIYQKKRRSYKPFVLGGGILFIISSYFLYFPLSEDELSLGQEVTPIYFLIAFLAFYLSWTVFEIPHLSWGGDLSADVKGRNRIFSNRALAFYIGTSVFFSLPLLPIFETSEFTPETLAWSVMIAAPVTLLAIFFCVFNVPDNRSIPQKFGRGVDASGGNKSFFKLAKNKPFTIFLMAFIFTGIGGGMWFGLIFIYVDSYLGLGNELSLSYLLGFLFSILTVFIWKWIAEKFDKNISWCAGMLLVMLGIVGTGFLSPGESGWWSLLVCMLLVNGGMASSVALAPSLLSDIIDYGSWKFGQKSSALYFSVYTFALKANIGIGVATGMFLAGLYGFDPSRIRIR